MRCGKEVEERGPAFNSYPPVCACGGLRRPGVIWFGEALPPQAIVAAEKAAASCELFLSLGTSNVVYPAAGLIELAHDRGVKLLEINPEPTPLSELADWSLRGKNGQVLPELLQVALGGS